MCVEPTVAPTCLERSALVDVERGLTTEWRLTNEVGVYASGSSLGATTRASHGLLVSSRRGEPRVLFAKVDEEIELCHREGGDRLALGTNEYEDGTVHPLGYLWLERFVADCRWVGWHWRMRGVALEKTVVLAPDRERTVIRYRLVDGAHPIVLRVTPFATDRLASETRRAPADGMPDVESGAAGAIVRASSASTPFGFFGSPPDGSGATRSARFVATGHWYWRFRRRLEGGVDDLFAPGLLAFELEPGDSCWVALSAEPEDLAAPENIDMRRDVDRAIGATTDGAVAVRHLAQPEALPIAS